MEDKRETNAINQTNEISETEVSKKEHKTKKQKEKKNQRKRKKWPWILLGIFLVLAIGITILVKWQWNNVLALYYASIYTPEQLQQMQKENEAVMQEICVKISDVDFSRLPEEAQKLLQNGELSEEDAVLILTGQISWEEFLVNQKEADESSLAEEIPTVSSPTYVSRMDEIIAKMYVLRSNYVGRLDSLVSQAWSEYKKGGVSKQDLINKYISIGYGLEGECDGLMEALLSELQTELSKSGGDTNLINDIRHTYLSQKSIKKAEMIAKYQK